MSETEKPCAACGAWWLPGSEKCDKHDPAAGGYWDERGRLILCENAPRVYAKSEDVWLGIYKIGRRTE
jgi:hypothetical protein